MEDFKLPEKKVTRKEYKEFKTFMEEYRENEVVRNRLLQDINDTLDGRILSNNIHNDSIETRHLRSQIVTTEKLVAKEILLATIAKDFNWSTLGNDGHKPADDADITSASNFVTVTYPADQSGLQTQIDGKIISWFTDTDPSGTWEGTDASHEGDMWWNTTSKKLKRYSGSAWSADIEDQKAVDAYSNASTAQDTADSKRRVLPLHQQHLIM